MKSRIFLPALALALVVSACGNPETATGEGVFLAYSYSPGDELTYAVTQEMAMDMEAAGGTALAGAFDAAMRMNLTSRLDYAITEGPDPETVEVTIETTIIEGAGQIESLGQVQTIPFEELAATGSTEVSVVLDAQGRPLDIALAGESLPPDLLDSIQGATGLGDFAMPQHMGPLFSDGPVQIRETWETGVETTSFGVDIRQRGEHRITGTEVVAGRNTYRIESSITTDGFTISFADIMETLAQEGADLGADAAELEATIAMFEMMDMSIDYRVGDTVVEMVSWFDVGAGILVRVEAAIPMTMEVTMANVPDAGDVTMKMDLDMDSTMQLAE